jgi:hypothetical protein
LEEGNGRMLEALENGTCRKAKAKELKRRSTKWRRHMRPDEQGCRKKLLEGGGVLGRSIHFFTFF